MVLDREELMIQLESLQKEVKDMEKPTLGASSIEEVDDSYQERLEYNYWLDEKEDEIKDLKNLIKQLADDHTE